MITLKTPVEIVFVPGANPPETTLTGQPPDSTGDTSASFHFAGSDDVSKIFEIVFESK